MKKQVIETREPRKPRVRRVVEDPPFLQVDTKGKMKTMKAEVFIHTLGNYLSTYSHHETSIFVNYIPIQHLLFREHNIRDEQWLNDETNRKFLSYHSSFNPTGNEFKVLKGVGLIPTGVSPVKYRAGLSIFADGKAYVLPVILPENLVYQKLHILKHGSVDLSRVIVLIDRDLDKASFPIRRLREIYRQELLPAILETSCTVFKVPLQFIGDNCFYNTGSGILPIKVSEREKARVEFADAFREYVSRESSITPGQVVYDGSISPSGIPINTATLGSSETVVIDSGSHLASTITPSGTW